VEQYPYDPFRSPERARAEEFGDVLAEGIYWLLDQGLSIGDADSTHWTTFLRKRDLFIRRVLDMVASDDGLDPADRARRLAALRGSLGRLAWITPELCMRYLLSWKTDQNAWRRHVEMLSPVADGATAISMLTRPEAPLLEYRIGGRGTGPAVIADPVSGRARHSSANTPVTQDRPPTLEPVRPHRLAHVGEEPGCSVDRI
jgi:hypothetical protein